MGTTTALPEQARASSPAGLGAALRRGVRARWAECGCAVALLLMAAVLLSVLPRKTITVDEFVHIPAGYAGWTKGDFRPNNEHPPLAKLWATWPLVLLGAQPPPDLPAEDPAQRTMLTARYFWQANAARFATLTAWARGPMIALTVALGAAIFAAARRAFGPRAALLAVACCALEPTILAHGRIVHTDIAAALAYLATWLALYAYLGRPTWGRAAGLGLALGLACATKYSLLVLIPIVAVAIAVRAALARRWGGSRAVLFGQAAVVAVVALLALNATYGFRHQPLDAIDLAAIRAERPADAERLIAAFETLSPVVPPYYLLGTYTVFGHNETGHGAALLGGYSQDGWWYYFPVAFALKTNLPFLLLTVGALAWAGWRVAARRDRRVLAFLLPPTIYLALAMVSRLNIGIRHILPVYPFLCILGGAACDRLLAVAVRAAPAARRAGRGRRPSPLARVARPLGVAVVALLLGWMAVEAARAYPNQLVYLNELARGPSWEYLSDSNIEWGDDTGALAAFLRAQGETRVRAAAAGSRDSLGFFGVEYLDYFDPQASATPTRYLALGASFLNGSTVPSVGGALHPDYFAAYRYRQPVAVFGGSIYLFDAPAPVAPLAAPLPPSAARATLSATDPPRTLRPGEVATIRVQLRNDGDATWPSSDRGEVRYQLRLGGRWFDAGGAALLRDDGRAPLFGALAPGERSDLRLNVTAPREPGDYLLRIDLVQEGVAWFGDRGGETIDLLVRVR